jgi:cell division transport system ATP-binding protein
MIRFEHVGLRYGIGPEVLSDINFTLEPGSFHFLTGPSGAGKTSLMSLMYLGRRPTRGLITMFGQNINGMDRAHLVPLRQRIGMVFQDFRLLPHMSVFDNVALPLRIQSKPEKEIRANVNELLEWVGLGQNLQQLPNTLSGGQQQRIAIARAVIGQPSLLLADEPTGNVDDTMAERLIRLFEEMNKVGTTVVLATHNEILAARLGYPRLHLEDGELSVAPARRLAVP